MSGGGLGVVWGWSGCGLGVVWGGLGVAWGWPGGGLGVAWGWPGGGQKTFPLVSRPDLLVQRHSRVNVECNEGVALVHGQGARVA